MSRKLFVVSDVHGHYTILKNALDEAGFDENNPDHIFLSCGDLFDRGNENVKVYNYVTGLQRKILIKGNHEDMLRSALERGRVDSTEILNGTDVTLEDFFGKYAIDDYGFFDTEAHADKIAELTSFIDSMLDYYETERYVFTHGWVPAVYEKGIPHIREDWREAPKKNWVFARYLEWQSLYGAGEVLDDKTIVCGHRAARYGHVFDSTRKPNCNEPFYGKGLIVLDAETVRSGKVNVLVIDEEEI